MSDEPQSEEPDPREHQRRARAKAPVARALLEAIRARTAKRARLKSGPRRLSEREWNARMRALRDQAKAITNGESREE